MREYVPLETFDLAWRWTSTGHAVLPAADLTLIRPLTPASAREVKARAIEGGEEVFEREHRCVDDEQARDWLQQLPISASTPVLVSWHHDSAVETTWSVFIRYWETFCYPGSDDVTIWSERATWSLCYRHDENLAFRTGA
jgi:hypothetical protein